MSTISNLDSVGTNYDGEVVRVTGSFKVNSNTGTAFITGLPAPSVSRVLANAVTTGSATSNVTISTTGTATITTFSSFSAGYTWNFQNFVYEL